MEKNATIYKDCIRPSSGFEGAYSPGQGENLSRTSSHLRLNSDKVLYRQRLTQKEGDKKIKNTQSDMLDVRD